MGVICYGGSISKPIRMFCQSRKVRVEDGVDLSVFIHQGGYREFIKYYHYYRRRVIDLDCCSRGGFFGKHNLEYR